MTAALLPHHAIIQCIQRGTQQNHAIPRNGIPRTVQTIVNLPLLPGIATHHNDSKGTTHGMRIVLGEDGIACHASFVRLPRAGGMAIGASGERGGLSEEGEAIGVGSL